MPIAVHHEVAGPARRRGGRAVGVARLPAVDVGPPARRARGVPGRPLRPARPRPLAGARRAEHDRGSRRRSRRAARPAGGRARIPGRRLDRRHDLRCGRPRTIRRASAGWCRASRPRCSARPRRGASARRWCAPRAPARSPTASSDAGSRRRSRRASRPSSARCATRIAATPREGYASLCHAIETMDLRDDLDAITAPTLRDRRLGRSRRRRRTTAPPSPRASPARGSGCSSDAAHLGNIEQPTAYNAAVLAHLRGGA